MPDDEEDPRHDPAAALAAIKAIHAAGGRTLGRDELIDFLTRPINLGWPTTFRETTPKDVLDWSVSMGRTVSDEFRELVRVDEAARAARNPKGAGRRAKPKTQYDVHYKRTRDLYRKLVKLPRRNQDAGYEAEPVYLATLQTVLADKTIPARQRAREVVNRLAKRGLPAPTEKTVRLHLAAQKKGSPGN